MVSSRLFVWGLVLVVLLILLPAPGETRSRDKNRQKDIKHRSREERETKERQHHQPQAQLRYYNEQNKKKKQEQHSHPPHNQKQKQKPKHGNNTEKQKAKDRNRETSYQKSKQNNDKTQKKQDKHKNNKINDGMLRSSAVDIPCGAIGGTCPDFLPCCSQWGFCGVGPMYCSGQGCQEQFGQCGEDVTIDDEPEGADNVGDNSSRRRKNKNNRDGKKKHRPHINSHGFDLQDRMRSANSQKGLALRIPTTVPKLPPNDTLVNIAYFPGWTQYRGQGRSKCHQRPYLPSTIPWSSLDYVIFAFVYFDEDNELYPADPSDEELYFTINQLKQPTQTRVVISIGGWSFTHPENKRDEGTRHRFETMVRSADSRAQFIESCIEFVKFYGFDGVDIDYEYPTFHDRAYVTLLFQEMRKAFDAEGSGLVLSLAGASFAEGVQGFELDKVAEVVDFMMIMAYGKPSFNI